MNNDFKDFFPCICTSIDIDKVFLLHILINVSGTLQGFLYHPVPAACNRRTFLSLYVLNIFHNRSIIYNNLSSFKFNPLTIQILDYFCTNSTHNKFSPSFHTIGKNHISEPLKFA